MKTNFDPNKPITITLGKDIRFMWPYVFEKRVNDDGEDKYELTLFIPYGNKDAIERFEDAIDEAIRRGFSGNMKEKSTFKKGTKESALRLPLKDGADKEGEYSDLFEGFMYCNAKTSRKPTVLDINGQEIIDPDEIYSGATGAVSITLFPYNNRAQGVGVQLNHVLKIADGERIGGGSISAEEAFADIISAGGGERARANRTRGEERSRSRTRGAESDDPLL